MRGSGSSSVSRKPARLGVNPRRSHVAEPERKRCKTACNVCNTRRIKCSGTQPCSTCTRDQRSCEYPVVEKKIYVAESLYKELCASKEILKACLAVQDPVQRQRMIESAQQSWATASQDSPGQDGDSEGASPAASSSTAAATSPEQYQQQQYGYPQRKGLYGDLSTTATEGKLLTDHHGTKRWLGGTSGATFLDHLKKFMHTLKSSLGINQMSGFQFMASRGQYQTSDSRNLYTPATVDNNTFPTNAANGLMASIHLAKVSEFLQGPTLPITDKSKKFSCGGIHYFGEFSYHDWLAVSQDPTRPELAFYEAAFALGTIYSLTAANSRRDGQLGETYFANARRILGDPMDVSRYNMRDVATLAILGMYMSENNRRDTAYVYFSQAITICCMFGGLTKGSSRELAEADKRIIWTLFCLTRDLGCLMGRPPLFPLEAIQLPSPVAVLGLPPPDGLIAHIELSKIADYIVSNTYAIAPRAQYETSDRLAPPVDMLKVWRENLPVHMCLPYTTVAEEAYEVHGSPPDRSLFMLHMKWNQLLILALRPLFFLAVKSAISADLVSDTWRDVFGDGDDSKRIEYIIECRAAARRNLCLGRHINELCKSNLTTTNDQGIPNDTPANLNPKLVMLDLHHIFNAAIVLLLYQMVSRNVVNTDTYGITEARRIFAIEARAEATSGYASDCAAVLNDLAALVARIRPLRFKDSEHVDTGAGGALDCWGPPPLSTRQRTPAHSILGDGAGGSRGSSEGCSTGTLGSPVAMLPSTEQLAANLRLHHPYGPDGAQVAYPPFLQAEEQGVMNGQGQGQQQPYTIRMELETWLREDPSDGQFSFGGLPLGGYTGL